MARKKAAQSQTSGTVKKTTPLADVGAKGELRFDYIKSGMFRVIHADGVYGGINPKGNAVHVAFFNERSAIPLQEVYSLDNGKIGQRTDRTVRQAVVREVECDVILDFGTARALHQWLSERLKEADRHLADQPASDRGAKK